MPATKEKETNEMGQWPFGPPFQNLPEIKTAHNT